VDRLTNEPQTSPDYMLAYAVAVLAHDPSFKDPSDISELKQVEKCLWLILEPLLANKELSSIGFYNSILDRIKHHKSAYKPDDELINHVITIFIAR
jgi:sister-chromatid-cohesion protein PDS5